MLFRDTRGLSKNWDAACERANNGHSARTLPEQLFLDLEIQGFRPKLGQLVNLLSKSTLRGSFPNQPLSILVVSAELKT